MSDKVVLYNEIGSGYNTTRCADPYITERLFSLLLPEKDQLHLDIGCGTGNYTIALANKSLDFYGVEPSAEMLDIARSGNSSVKWLMGTAEQIPADDNTFNSVIATLTIHHWANIKSALKEINRVLTRNGNVVLFTALPEQMKGYWLNHYFPNMMTNAIHQMPSYFAIENAASETGFTITGTEEYFVHPDLQDHFLYAGKHNPGLYLDESIRKGISSFAALSNSGEVKQGLNKLADDIKTNTFLSIKDQYHNNMGDYLFITLKKEIALDEQPTIRDATVDDIDSLTLLMNELGYPTNADEMHTRFNVIKDQPDYKTIVVTVNNEIAGMAGLHNGIFYEKNGRYLRIVAFVVKQGVRNRGIGKVLLNACENWAVEQGLICVVLTSGNRENRKDAHAFYQKMGYEIKSSGFVKQL